MHPDPKHFYLTFLEFSRRPLSRATYLLSHFIQVRVKGLAQGPSKWQLGELGIQTRNLPISLTTKLPLPSEPQWTFIQTSIVEPPPCIIPVTQGTVWDWMGSVDWLFLRQKIFFLFWNLLYVWDLGQYATVYVSTLGAPGNLIAAMATFYCKDINMMFFLWCLCTQTGSTHAAGIVQPEAIHPCFY